MRTRLLSAAAVAAVAAVAVGLLPVSPASAAVSDICPAAGQTNQFTDDEGSVHEPNINCAAAYQLVTGTTATTYAPNGNLTRGQAATILVNYVERATGTTLTTDATPDFTDTAGNVHATNIEKAADNNIVRGFTGGTFRPDQLITRAQFASIAVQATERVLGSALPTNATNAFDDDNGNVHESNIEKAADNGILEGTGPRTFSPNANVTRGQTATIVIRAAGNVLFPAGRFAPRTGASVTGRPELVSAQIVGTVQTIQVTPTSPAGTTVRYTFDEPVGTVATVANFHVYRFNSPNTPLNADAASIDASNRNAVLVRYNALTNDPGQAAASTADLSVATVDINAVVDLQGLSNPEGDAALGTGVQTGGPVAAGRTAAPDLVSIGFRTGATTTQTAVDFVFDQAAYVQNAGGFRVVLTDASEIQCMAPATDATTAGGGTSPGGAGTTTITVACPNPGGLTTLLSAANVARGTVDALSVGTTPATGVAAFAGVGGAACGSPNVQGTVNRCNPLTTSDTPDTGTIAPDLVSVRFVAPTTTGGNSTVIYTLDQPVAAAGAGADLFCVYNNLGAETCNTAQTPAINVPGGSTEVAVTFPGTAIANAAGGNVRDAALTGQGGQVNQQDEAAATNVTQPTQTTQPAGRTTGPDLVSVSLAQGGTFGNLFVATYTFDEAILGAVSTAVGNPNAFRLYLATGTGMVASSCSTGPAVTGTTTANTVVCSGYTIFSSPNVPTPSATAATNAQVGSATLGTVDNNAVTDAAANQNPEGAAATTGGTGTPQ